MATTIPAEMAQPALKVPHHRRGRRSLLFQERIDGYVMILPWLPGFVIFTDGPMLVSTVLAFTNYDILTPPKITGFANVSRLLQDELFYKSPWNTAYWLALVCHSMCSSP